MTSSKYISTGAEISACGLYRYSLHRAWDEVHLNTVNFVMLNPSTADGAQEDATIRRCVGFARSCGYGALVVTNLFAYRSTNPNGLLTAHDPIGPDNDQHLKTWASIAGPTIFGWGAHTFATERSRAVYEMLRQYNPQCLRLTKSGAPAHPLYLPGNLKPVRFEATSEKP